MCCTKNILWTVSFFAFVQRLASIDSQLVRKFDWPGGYQNWCIIVWVFVETSTVLIATSKLDGVKIAIDFWFDVWFGERWEPCYGKSPKHRLNTLPTWLLDPASFLLFKLLNTLKAFEFENYGLSLALIAFTTHSYLNFRNTNRFIIPNGVYLCSKHN